MDPFAPEIKKQLADALRTPATAIAERMGWERSRTVLIIPSSGRDVLAGMWRFISTIAAVPKLML